MDVSQTVTCRYVNTSMSAIYHFFYRSSRSAIFNKIYWRFTSFFLITNVYVEKSEYTYLNIPLILGYHGSFTI